MSVLDGCYIVHSTVSPEELSKTELVDSYRKLAWVEMAFRNLKTVQLEVRPIFHKTNDRIRSHVFLCMLAYYLQWHLLYKLKPLFEADGQYKNRQWTFEAVIRRLACIRKEIAVFQGVEVEHITTPDAEQKFILDLLGVKL
jgi:transposase